MAMANKYLLILQSIRHRRIHRRIMWLEIAGINNDPSVILPNTIKKRQHYLEERFPMVVRSNRGTENTPVRRLQIFYRNDENDAFSGNDWFLFSTSPSN